MYYMGVDVSKHHRDATVIDATGQQVMTPFRFPNTRRGVNTLLARIQRLDGQPCMAKELSSFGHSPSHSPIV